MNELPIHRIFAAMVEVINSDILPDLSDDFARSQAFAMIDLLSNLGSVVDYAQAPLADAIRARETALDEIHSRLAEGADVPGRPDPPANTSVEELIAYRKQLDQHIIDLLGYCAEQAGSEREVIATLLHRTIEANLLQARQLTKKSMFGER